MRKAVEDFPDEFVSDLYLVCIFPAQREFSGVSTSLPANCGLSLGAWAGTILISFRPNIFCPL